MHLALLVVVAVLAAASQQVPTTPSTSNVTIPPADCSIEPRSCGAFNQMLAAKDEDFTGIQDKNRTTYVCFEQHEFLALSFSNPEEDKWVRREPGMVEKQGAFVLFQSYADGVEDANQLMIFTWLRNPRTPNDIYAHPNEEKNDSEINTREVTFVFEFVNLAKRPTTRTIKIRRSTQRFTDTFLAAAPDAKADPQYENRTGHCTVYPK